MKTKYKAGDKVRLLQLNFSSNNLTIGKIYKVKRVLGRLLEVTGDDMQSIGLWFKEVELVKDKGLII